MKSKIMKKLLLVVVCTGVLLALGAVTAFADDYGNFSYTLSDDETYVSIDSYSEDTEELVTIEIPDSIDDAPVTTISSGAFAGNSIIGDVVFSSSVTTISSYAFANCSGLTAVIIGDGVETIGEFAFYNCENLKYVYISDSVTTISAEAFKNCTSLEYVRIGDNVITIGRGAFYGCTSLESIYIPASVEEIGENAFGVWEEMNIATGTSAFAFYSDSSEAVDDYILVFPNFTDNEFDSDCAHESVSWTLVREATDNYLGVELAFCSDCHQLLAQDNTEIVESDEQALTISFIVIAVLIVAFCIVVVVYVKRSKVRRAKAIEAYRAEHPEYDEEERQRQEAKAAAKAKKEAAKQAKKEEKAKAKAEKK